MQEYILPNLSGCLGSYGLIFRPGDFVLVSAIDLDSLVGVKNSLKMNELHPLPTTASYFPHLLYLYPDIDELIFLRERFYRHYESWVDLYWNFFNNYHFSYNIFDFAHKYLTVGIGEPVFMVRGIDNPQARSLLHELLSAARIKAERERLSDLLRFVDGFVEYNYAPNEERKEPRRGIEFDFRGGGIGIIHTTINLGE